MPSTQFTAVDLISKKQKGGRLAKAEIDWFVRASSDGRIPDYQLSAFLMAVYFRGMTLEETRDLTESMIRTGVTLKLKGLRGAPVDKHSTGGVGDKVSLILGPLVASLGVSVPMISGRALGHTGGTLDKLESIPGFRTDLGPEEFERVVRTVGISIIGQTREIVPADKKFYAIRDVTSTVVCPPLIVASILSKKIAAGARAVVFDIKTGRGAFMETTRDACNLARMLDRVGAMLGIKTSAILTRMDEPLGSCVGNAMEVRESIEVLKGRMQEGLVEVTLALGSEMLLLAGKAGNREEGHTLLRTALLGGKGIRTFKAMVEAQGGDARVVEDTARLPQARHKIAVRAARAGYVARIDALSVGKIAIMLGGGRLRRDDLIDHAVGIEIIKRSGSQVAEGDTLALVHANESARGRRAAANLTDAITLSGTRPRGAAVVIGRVTPGGIEKLGGLRRGSAMGR